MGKASVRSHQITFVLDQESPRPGNRNRAPARPPRRTRPTPCAVQNHKANPAFTRRLFLDKGSNVTQAASPASRLRLSLVYPDFFFFRIEDPQFIHSGARIDQAFLIEIEMCALRREDLDDKVRCSFCSLFGKKTAPPLRKEAQVKLENIDVGQHHIKRRSLCVGRSIRLPLNDRFQAHVHAPEVSHEIAQSRHSRPYKAFKQGSAIFNGDSNSLAFPI
jgi:hypothetical protein